MAGEWIKRKIGSLGRVVTGKTPPTADSSNVGGPYPFITIPDLNGRVLIDQTERTVSESGAEMLRSCLLPPGSVMMSCIATVGRCGITTQPSFTNQQINSVIPNNEIDSRFRYYVFTQLGHELESAGGGGSVYTNVSKNRFSDIEVVIPAELNEQRAIAHILGTLDDKIELNRRMSETLEAIARALFESWFVRFDPVRRNMARKGRGQPSPGLRPPSPSGREAGGEGVVEGTVLPSPSGRRAGDEGVVESHAFDHLFPDRLVDSELGPIPEGWKVGQLGNLAEVTSGKRPSEVFQERTPEAEIPLWGGNGPMGYVRESLYSRPILLTGRVGTLGSVFRIVTPCWTSDNTLVVIAREQIAYEFLYFRMMAIDFDALNRGSTQPLLTQSDLSMPRFSVPPRGVLNKFHERVSGYFLRIEHVMNESRTIVALRDALLPKLISGELRVKDTEAFLKERGL